MGGEAGRGDDQAAAAESNGLGGLERLPFSLKVLLENMRRHEDGRTVTSSGAEAAHA